MADRRGLRHRIREFDITARDYTGRTWPRLDDAAFAIGNLTMVEKDLFLVIERDNNQGAAAAFKKIFIVDFTQVDAAGYLRKREVVDLLRIVPTSVGVGSSPFLTQQGHESNPPVSGREEVCRKRHTRSRS
jgi:hypothetical protein